MKINLYWLASAFALLLGCQPAHEEEITEAIQGAPSERWQLVKSINAWTGQVTHYDTVASKTYYIFHPDNTFIKFTTEGDTVVGTYEYTRREGADLELSFPEGSELRDSCIGGKEFFTVSADTLINDVRPCDGPRLYYVQ